MQCRLMLDFSLSKQEAEGSNVQLVQKLRDLCTAILKVSSHSTMWILAIHKQSLMLMSVASTAYFALGSFQCPCGRYQVKRNLRFWPRTFRPHTSKSIPQRLKLIIFWSKLVSLKLEFVVSRQQVFQNQSKRWTHCQLQWLPFESLKPASTPQSMSWMT